MFEIDVTIEKVTATINKLRHKKIPRVDGISQEMIKY